MQLSTISLALTRLGGAAFSPSSLFAGGVQGAWYDPSDLTTLFQDSAGTTPVTAVEQPVGLMLDKSKGLVLGAELVTNGTFDTNLNGWTLSGTPNPSWSAGGVLMVDTADLRQTLTTVAGATYLLTFSVSGSFSSCFINVGTSNGGNELLNIFIPSSGRVVFTATTTTSFLRFLSSTGRTFTLDNISVRALPGNHAYQTTSASRPTLRARYNLLTYSEDFNNTSGWLKNNGSGGSTVVANKFIPNNGVTSAYLNAVETPIASGGTYKLSVRAAAAGFNFIQVAGDAISGRIPGNIVFNLQSGVVESTSGGAAGTISAFGDGSYICVATFPASTANAARPFIRPRVTATTDATGDGVSGIQLYYADLRPTNIGSAIPAYQRVGAATDYATGAAFPPYLFCDGIDDSMLTNSVDFATVTSDGQARRNLLSNPTQFDAAATWSGVTNVSVSANSTAAPDGTTTADTLIEAATTSTHWLGAAPSSISITTVQYTLSIYAKDNGRRYFQVYFGGGASPVFYGNFDLVGLATGSSSAATTLTISDAGNGWRRCSITFTSVASGATSVVFALINSASAAALASYTGDGTSGVFIWGAQLETGSTATAFQNIGTDKMLVVAGVTKNAVATGFIAETSAAAESNNGAFRVGVDSGGIEYFVSSRGTTSQQVNIDNAAYLPPVTNVVQSSMDIAAPSVSVRLNGVAVGSNTSSQGTGNYGNYPLYIGRRNNATFPFNGNIYSLIIAGQSYTAGQISSTESWVAAKTPLGTI